MNYLRRWLYLGYYFRNMNWEMLRRFMAFTRQQQGTPYWRQWLAIFSSSLKYNISPLEYYQFRFADLSPDQRQTWAGTGTMYEFQLVANPLQSREVLNDKRKFYQAYRQFFRHQMFTLEQLQTDQTLVESLLKQSPQLVFKSATGKCGTSVRIEPSAEFDPATLIPFMQQHHYDLVETFLQQHPALHQLSPSAVNTVRIFTRLDEQNRCIILGCRLRISVNSNVDNLAAGNLAAPVDEKTGIVSGEGVYSDITKSPVSDHPVTGVPIVGFRIPFWSETLAMVDQASRLHPENRSIGWDIVITEDGPGLIEGNHDWCKLVWQLPVKQGLKRLLEKQPVGVRIDG